jgi:monoterpene epsilon-lactone hydrolase
MSEDDLEGALRVPPRVIPVPRHLSPEAQAMLAAPWPEDFSAYPALDDKEGWRQHIARSDAMIMQMVEGNAVGFEAQVSERREGEALAYEIVPEGLSRSDRRVLLDVHGGALIMGAGAVCQAMAMGMARLLGTRTVSVDYRMPPDHPYPAGLDDCVAVYRTVLRDHRPEEIIIGGLSAGGNLAAALILRARDEGLPLPAAALLLSPEVDLTESGDSFQTNKGIDATLRDGLMPANLLYAGGHDLRDPYVSPLFGDFSKGFPPTLLTAGTRDLFLSNAVRMHRALRAAGIPAELHIMEAAPHGAFAGWPEVAELNRDVRAFCEARWKGVG